jgi:selenocysteine lyase/cysteine desulfurase
MDIDLAKARADTPGTEHVMHFNNAGAALMPRCVVGAQTGHIELEARIGGYEAAAKAATQVETTYKAIAELLNCGPDEVALVDSATTAWDLAMLALPWREGDRVLVAEAEYVSNMIALLRLQKRHRIEIVPVPSDADGVLDPEALEARIDARTRLIAVTHVPTNGGLVNPAAEIGRIARRHGVTYLLDACQSAGQLELDVQAIGCHLLSATGRKYLRGPRGTGFLYVARDLLAELDPPLLDMRGAVWTSPDAYEMRADAKRFETFEFNYAAVIGLGVAVDYALSWGLPAIAARIDWLAQTLRRRLARIQGVQLRDLGRDKCGNVTFPVDGRAATDVQAALHAQGINVSVSDPASTLFDAQRRHLPELVRASVHYYNSETEVDRLCRAVADLGRAAA